MELTHGSPTETEEFMGTSHQAGWVVLRGKQYFRRRVLDPRTEQE